MTDAPRGVLFDVDGTLVDTNYLHVIAWFRAFEEAGEWVPMASIHRVIGMGSDLLIERLVGHEPPGVRERHSEEFRRLRQEMRAFPRGKDLLREVSRRGAKVVLASSANKEDLDAMRQAIDADDVIDEFTSAADVETSKPAPDIFDSALDRTGLDAEHAIVVGDTVWDVEAAKGAGLDTVGVLTGGISRQELLEAGAVAVYADVSELLDQLDDSPLAPFLIGG